MTSDISEGESHGMNSRNSSRVSSQSGKGRYSAQTMRMLKEISEEDGSSINSFLCASLCVFIFPY